MFQTLHRFVAVLFAVITASACIVLAQEQDRRDAAQLHAQNLVNQGRQIFRFDTFGDEALWGGQLRLHEAIEGGSLGGIGTALSPRAALDLGLKVDIDALPNRSFNGSEEKMWISTVPWILIP